MSEQNIPILSLPATASGAVTANRFVGYDGAQSGAAAAGMGVARSTVADGEMYTVDVLGTAVVASGAAISLGAELEADADGKAVTRSAGVKRARALQAASAADQLIEVLLIAG